VSSELAKYKQITRAGTWLNLDIDITKQTPPISISSLLRAVFLWSLNIHR
jgi:hypothetical protein